MLSNKPFIKNTVMQYLMVAAQYVFPLITFPYLTRVLGNESYGIHTYMISVVTCIQIFVDYGFILSSTSQISANRYDTKYVQKIFSETIFAKGILFLGAMIFLSALIPFQAILREHVGISYLYMGTVFFSLFTADFLFRGIEKMEILTYRFVASKIVTTGLTFVMVHNSSDLFWVPLLNMIGSFVAVAMTWYHINAKLKLKMRVCSVSQAIAQIRRSTVYFVSNIATTAFGAFTTIVMGFSLTAVEISYWGASYNLITTAQSLYSPIINSLFPHMVKNKDIMLVKKIQKVFLPLILGACVLCYFISPYIILIMCGKGYMPGLSTFRYLIPVLLFSFPAMLLGFPVLGVMGYTNEVTKCTLVAAVYHVIGIAVLFALNVLTIERVALLRSSTEMLLLATRVYYCNRYRVLSLKEVSESI